MTTVHLNSTDASMKQRQDPFSTPARRRRIIADVAKGAIRFYYITACQHVRQFRIDTAAALRIQCAFRQFSARKTVSRLKYARRYSASVAIQTKYRQRLAVRKRRKLEMERKLRNEKRLARVVEHLHAIRSAKLYRAALLLGRQLREGRKRTRYCREIQRVYRGHVARRHYRHIRYQCRLKRYRRFWCAILVQSVTRGYLSRLRLRRWKQRRSSARHVIASALIMNSYLQRRRRALERRNKEDKQRLWRMHQAVTVLQCMVRCRFARMELTRRKLRPPRIEIARSTVHSVAMEIPSYMLSSLLNETDPNDFFGFCSQHSLLQFSIPDGFQPGTVLKQVLRNAHEKGREEAVAVDKWELCAPFEGKAPYPQSWKESSSVKCPHSWVVSAVLDLSSRILQLTLNAPAVELSRGIRRGEWVVQQHVEALQLEVRSLVSEATPVEVVNDLSSTIFHVLGAKIYVPRPRPPPNAVISPPPAIVFDDEDSVASPFPREFDELSVAEQSMVLVEPAEDEEQVEEVQVFMRAPVPEPVIDYGHHATTIQCNYRHFCRRRRRRAAVRVQQWWRWFRRHERWLNTVYDYWALVFDSAVLVQCLWRKFRARRRLEFLRSERERLYFPFGQGFRQTQSAAERWRMLGLDPRACGGSVLSMNVQPAARSSSWIGEVVGQLQIPEAPPNLMSQCSVLESGSSVATVDDLILCQPLVPHPGPSESHPSGLWSLNSDIVWDGAVVSVAGLCNIRDGDLQLDDCIWLVDEANAVSASLLSDGPLLAEQTTALYRHLGAHGM